MGRSDTEATRGWTEGKPWEIAWGELRWEGAIRKRQEAGRKGNRVKSLVESSGGKERYRSDDRVDGRETVGNSLGRAPMGRSDTEATRGWTEGKPCEIACGELRWEGAIRKRQRKPCEIAWRALVGRSDTGMTTGSTEGKPYCLGKVPVIRSDMGATTGWTEGKSREIAWGELRWEGAILE